MNIYKIIWLVLLLTVSGIAQNTDELYRLYQQNNVAELKEVLQAFPDPGEHKYDLQFFKTLYLQNGEQAKLKYQRIFDHGDAKIKLLAAKKLMDYFYSIGYYVTATKYQKYIVEHSAPESKNTIKPVVGTQPQQKYFIQVGAFGLHANAFQRVKFLGTQDVKSEVVDRQVNGKMLFCVWIEGSPDLDKTLLYANKIKQKFDLEFQIMKK